MAVTNKCDRFAPISRAIIVGISHNIWHTGSTGATQDGRDGLNCCVGVRKKYTLIRSGLLTSTTCSCTVPILPHTLWNNTHETTPYPIRSMHCGIDRIRTLCPSYFTYRTVHIGENVT